MLFRPNPHDELVIDGVSYRIAEHPAAPGIPYGQEGRAGIVYRLLHSSPPKDSSSDHGMALKVFKSRFRLPSLVSQAEKLSAYAGLPGLEAAKRTVLTPQRHRTLLRQYSDLTYAVLMPWIEGSTWLDILLDRNPLPAQRSQNVACHFAEMLSQFEQRGAAHCDLSASNVMFPLQGVALIDLEGIYGPGMLQPQALSSGSAGYAHRQTLDGLWSADADRFAGAVLLAEMLGWCDPQVCTAAWGESYFDPREMQTDSRRYQTLLHSLESHWGREVSGLFERAWTSYSLSECPTLGEWLVCIPESQIHPPISLRSPAVPAPALGDEASLEGVRACMQRARQLEDDQDLDGAIAAYREAMKLAATDPHPSLRSHQYEISLTLQDLEVRRAALQPVAPPPAPVVVTEPPQVTWIDPAPASKKRSLDPSAIALAILFMMMLVVLLVSRAFPTPTLAAPLVGTDMYFTSDRDGKQEIYILEADANLNQVTHTAEMFESWSPFSAANGNLYFTSDRTGKQEVYVLESTGTLKQVTHTEGAYESWGPSLSWDGKLYFTSNRSGKAEIYVLEANDVIKQVTHTPEDHESWSPAVGPDGDLYFTSDRTGKSEIYVLEAQTGLRQVTHTDGRYESWAASVSADGKLYFTSNRSGKSEIYVLESSSPLKQVTHTDEPYESWSPFIAPGGDLYFTSNRTGKAEIYVLETAGTLKQVTHSPWNYQSWVSHRRVWFSYSNAELR